MRYIETRFLEETGFLSRTLFIEHIQKLKVRRLELIVQMFHRTSLQCFFGKVYLIKATIYTERYWRSMRESFVA